MRGNHPTQTHMGRQWETRGGKTSGKRMHHLWGSMKGNHRVDTPSNTGPNIRGGNGRQGETRGDKTSRRQTRHPTQARMWENNGREGGGKTPGRWAHHPTQAHMWETMGHKRGQGETRPREGGHMHLPMGNKRRQDLGKAGTASNAGTHAGRQWETRADKTSGRRIHQPTQADMWGVKGRQDVGKADPTQNTQVG